MHCRLILPLLLAAGASGQTITVFAGNGTAGYTGDTGPATLAEINRLVGLASDAAGNIYLADQNNNVVCITLAPNGHYAFTLGSDRYPAALHIRGTIEFVAPTGAAIGALGIRIPAGATTTYTTLPALAK